MRSDTGIIAVIVLYRTKLEQCRSFLSLSASLACSGVALDLVVYDNSPEYNLDKNWGGYPNWNIVYVADHENGGVSRAYNTAAKIAAEKNKKWLLLLDQDTDFPIGTINEYLSSLQQYPSEKLFAPIMVTSDKKIVSPCLFMLMRGFPLKSVSTGIQSLDGLSLINCGLCIEVGSFFKNGGYNELIRLDFSDHDFIRRFKKSVQPSFVTINLQVIHELSSETKNSAESDLSRFDIYLNGLKYVDASLMGKIMLKIHAILRSFKLSVVHRNFSFINIMRKWV